YDTITEFFVSSKDKPGEGGSKMWLLILLGSLGILGIVFLIFRKRLDHIKIFNRVNALYESFLEGIKGLTRIRRPIAFFVHSVVIWVCYYLMVYFCFYCIPQTSGLGAAAGLTVLVTSTLAVVLPSPGGVGTFHYFVPIALTLYGIDAKDGLTYATIAHAAQMLMFVLFGTISLISMIILQRKNLSE
ncbi:MAG TPA: hypothetical protein DIW47_14005, partial [Bacteroidetes bacterium]|nr:hypothetical protein [Bacteroidota bacterium]